MVAKVALLMLVSSAMGFDYDLKDYEDRYQKISHIPEAEVPLVEYVDDYTSGQDYALDFGNGLGSILDDYENTIEAQILQHALVQSLQPVFPQVDGVITSQENVLPQEEKVIASKENVLPQEDRVIASQGNVLPRESGAIASEGNDYAMRFGNVKSSRLEDHGGSIEAQNLQNTLAQSFQSAYPSYYGGYAPFAADYAMRFGNVQSSQLQDHGGSIEAHNLKNTLAQSFQPAYVKAPYSFGGYAPYETNMGYAVTY